LPLRPGRQPNAEEEGERGRVGEGETGALQEGERGRVGEGEMGDCLLAVSPTRFLAVDYLALAVDLANP